MSETAQQKKTEQDEPAKASAKPANHTPNLEAIMHVPLEVSIELGRISIPLHTVVRMSRGTVLKMEKEADAVVDILANGTVFARGEVVKADGKLGVRVTEVVSPTERIRALA